ncbi:glucuronate isomerase [uncultured Maribacter sp.]|uniref:glucuronate isomerase n=1 Tax=uncultured Maribacter sp. TaxID=431308 RepID=UPI00260A60B7|nr:glucuronate isomerase [uncultured Maribacter sp.]
MTFIKSKTFITDNFLLQTEIAETLYHTYAKDLPIIDYHNHLSARKIAENEPVRNITEVWLDGDHYKWRGMRANGVEEKYITGTATLEERFNKWAETVPYTVRNPLFHWTQLELKRYFNVDDILQSSTAKAIYKKANTVLENKTPAQLLEDMKVEVVCTTDDPTDNLKYHKQIKEKGNFYTKVLPTFRADELFFINKKEFSNYIQKLGVSANLEINTLANFLKAIDKRIHFFNTNGCRLSDFGIGAALRMVDYTLEGVSLIFDKKLKENKLTINEIDEYRSFLFVYLGKKYHEYNWVQQYHLGPIRNNNTLLLDQVGTDAGVDSIGDYPMAEFMSQLFNTLNSTNQLAKAICYNLNPSQNEVFATMMGNFQSSDCPGKMQWGSGWWFLDQKDGMEKQLNTLSNMGLLSRFVGMLTDSRSFLSFPRHEYFRRVLCNLIANDVVNGLVPNDMEFLGKMISDICYQNAVNYFNFEN